jgi:hypothetical protein
MKKPSMLFAFYIILIFSNNIYAQIGASITIDSSCRSAFCDERAYVDIYMIDTTTGFFRSATHHIELEVKFQNDINWHYLRVHTHSSENNFMIWGTTKERIRRKIDLLPVIINDTTLISELSYTTIIDIRFRVSGEVDSLSLTMQTWYSDTISMLLPPMNQDDIDLVRFIVDSDNSLFKMFSKSLWTDIADTEVLENIYTQFPNSDISNRAKFICVIRSNLEAHGNRAEQWSSATKSEVRMQLQELLLAVKSSMLADDIQRFINRIY